MERERGIVQQAGGSTATIRIQKSSYCATCGSRDKCQTLSDRDMLIEVTNDLHAKEGDQVEITVPTRSLLKLSLLVYLLPIVLLIVGAYIGGEWAQSSQSDPTLPSVIGGMGAMILSFLILKGFDRKLRGKQEYSPRMLRILSSADAPRCGDNK